jgi:hypothetical protein
MKKVSEYRQRAAECRALAAKMDIDENRAQLLAMAQTWDTLAEERARALELTKFGSFGREPPESGSGTLP